MDYDCNILNARCFCFWSVSRRSRVQIWPTQLGGVNCVVYFFYIFKMLVYLVCAKKSYDSGCCHRKNIFLVHILFYFPKPNFQENLFTRSCIIRILLTLTSTMPNIILCTPHLFIYFFLFHDFNYFLNFVTLIYFLFLFWHLRKV